MYKENYECFAKLTVSDKIPECPINFQYIKSDYCFLSLDWLMINKIDAIASSHDYKRYF